VSPPLSLAVALVSPEAGSVVVVVVVVVDDVVVGAIVEVVFVVLAVGVTGGGVTGGVTEGVTASVVVADVVGLTGGGATGGVTDGLPVLVASVWGVLDVPLPQALVKSIPASRLASNVNLNSRICFITPHDLVDQIVFLKTVVLGKQVFWVNSCSLPLTTSSRRRPVAWLVRAVWR
jgi:hypothetical protein